MLANAILMRDLNIILAKSYLNIISIRSKDPIHTEQILNTLDQINYLEDQRRKAIKLLNQKETELKSRSKQIKEKNKELSDLKIKLQELQKENDILTKINKGL